MSQAAKAALKEAGPSRHDTAALGQLSAVSSQLDHLEDATLQALTQVPARQEQGQAVLGPMILP